MWSRSVTSFTLRRITATRCRMSSTEAAAAAAAAGTVKLHFSLPHQTLYKGASVYSVILPGVEGEYGVTANHVPYVAQLKPGVLQILHEATNEPEKYFIAGGYAFTHDDSITEVVCPEAVKLDDIDSAAVAKQFEAAKNAFNSSVAGSVEQAEAQIAMEVNKDLGLAVGLNLS